MDAYTPNLFITVFFLITLVLLERFREQITVIDKSSYKYITGGIVILTFMSLGRVFSLEGVFDAVPFLSDPLFFKLIGWIGTITGITFLVSGMSSWMPLAKNYKKTSNDKLRQLDFIRKIEQLVSFENRPDKVFVTALDYMKDHFRLTRAAVCKFSVTTRKMYLVATVGHTPEQEQQLTRLLFDPEGWGKYLQGMKIESSGAVSGLGGILGRPDMILPVAVNERPAAFFMLWPNEEYEINREEGLNLKIAADIIARKIFTDRVVLRDRFEKECDELQASVLKQLDQGRPFKDNLAAFYRKIKSTLPVDILSLSLLNHNLTRLNRYSVGENETVLEEKGLTFYGERSLTSRVIESGEAVRVNDLKPEYLSEADALFRTGGIKSVLALLLNRYEPGEGVLIVGSRKLNAYRHRESRQLTQVLPLLREQVREEKNRDMKTVQHRRIALLNAFVDEINKTESLHDVFDIAVRMLYNELHTTLVRIATLEDRGAFLKPRTVRVQPSAAADMTAARGPMIVSMMPIHKQAVESGQQVLIDQSTNGERMSELESRLTLSADLTTSLLVPIRVREKVFALITLAERRNRERFQYSPLDILFVNGIAQAISMAMQLSLFRRRAESGSDRARLLEEMNQVEEFTPEVKSRIKSALTGIMGSVEILKSRAEKGEVNPGRYIDIIDRSARKINDYCRADKAGV
ncbi:MAG: GAF domain-containing protein [Candidatus Zixiibacteriota bacterium]